jgi:hypothetical protein
VIPLFLDGGCRGGQGALAILGVEVFDPKRGISQPAFNRIAEDVFDLFVYESGSERSRVCAAQDGADRFNEIAIHGVQLPRIALQAGFGELLTQEGKNREKQAKGEDNEEAKSTQAGGFILSKYFPYADDGDRHDCEHPQQRNVFAIVSGPESIRVCAPQDGSKHFSEIAIKGFEPSYMSFQIGFGEVFS